MKKLLYLYLISLWGLSPHVQGQYLSPEEAKCGSGQTIKLENITGGDTMVFTGMTRSEAKQAWQDSVIASNGAALESSDVEFVVQLCPGCPDGLPGCEPEFSSLNLNAVTTTDGNGNPAVRVNLSSAKEFTYKCASCRVDQNAINNMATHAGPEPTGNPGDPEATCGGPQVNGMEIEHPTVHSYEVEAPSSDSAQKMFKALLAKDNGNGWKSTDENRVFGCPSCPPNSSGCEMEVTQLPYGSLVTSLGGGKYKIGTATGRVTIDYKCNACDSVNAWVWDPNGDDDNDGIPNWMDIGGFRDIYPNPTFDWLHLEFEFWDPAADVRIEFIDPMSGPVLIVPLGPRPIGVFLESLDLSFLPPGLYEVVLYANNVPVDSETVLKQ